MINQTENENLKNHSKSNLQLESEHNLKPNNIIDVKLPAESKIGLFLLIIRKFLHVEIPILKKNRSDDKKIDISNSKYVCVLIAYIAELENKVELVYYVNIRISIPKIYQKIINNPVFTKKWKDVINLKLKVLISNFTWTETVLSKDINFVLSR